MKLRKWVALPAFLLLLIYSAFAYQHIRKSRLHDNLQRSVRMYNIGYASHIELAAYADFEWDLFHIFPPYTTPEMVNQALGIEWHWADWNTRHLRSKDDRTLLVWVRSGRVVRSLEMERELADFTLLAQHSPLTPQEAQFFVIPGSETELGLLSLPE